MLFKYSVQVVIYLMLCDADSFAVNSKVIAVNDASHVVIYNIT